VGDTVIDPMTVCSEASSKVKASSLCTHKWFTGEHYCMYSCAASLQFRRHNVCYGRKRQHWVVSSAKEKAKIGTSSAWHGDLFGRGIYATSALLSEKLYSMYTYIHTYING
jgi:hypothetical protein